MAKQRLPYREGTWFAVPLRDGGYGVGLVARLAGDGRVFGYFFGPKRDAVPDLEAIREYRPSDAVWINRFGDPGFLKGAWPIIGHDEQWRRQDWPLPAFIRINDEGTRAEKVTYSDALERLSVERCDPALSESLPEDMLSGWIALRNRLTKLLSQPADAGM